MVVSKEIEYRLGYQPRPIKNRGIGLRAKISAFYALVFACLYFPYVSALGLTIPTLLFSHVLLASIYLVRGRVHRSELFLPCFVLASLAVVSLSAVVGDGVLSLRVIQLAFYLPCLVFSSRYLAREIERCYPGKSAVVVSNVVAFHSLLIIALNFGVLRSDVFYSIISVDPKVFSYPITRYPGFAFDAFSYVSVLHALGFCIMFERVLSARTLAGRAYLIFAALIILISVVVSGRAGLVVVLLYFCFKCIQLDRRAVRYITFIVLFAFVSFLFDWGRHEWYKDWAFSFIISALSGGGVDDSSVRNLATHVFLPENLILGDSTRFVDVPSDMGLVRIFVSLGVLGLALFVAYYSLFFYYALKAKYALGGFLAVTLLLLNFKDVYFISPYGHTFLVFFLCFGEYYHKARKRIRQ